MCRQWLAWAAFSSSFLGLPRVRCSWLRVKRARGGGRHGGCRGAEVQRRRGGAAAAPAAAEHEVVHIAHAGQHLLPQLGREVRQPLPGQPVPTEVRPHLAARL